MVYGNISCGGSLNIFSRAKPTLRQPLADTRKSSEETHSTYLPAAPSFPRRRESRPLIFRNIQRLPQRVLCPQIWFAEISVAAGLYIFSRAKPTLRQPLADTRKSSEKTHSISLPAAPSFPRRRESRPLIFRNIQRLPQYGLCPRMRFAEILVLAGRLCFTGETRHIFRQRFYSNQTFKNKLNIYNYLLIMTVYLN